MAKKKKGAKSKPAAKKKKAKSGDGGAAALKKHGFWIASGVTLIAGLVVWYLATSSLAAETAEMKGKIKGAFSMVGGLPREHHPNDESIKKIEEETEKRAARIRQQWEAVYQRQLQLLTWKKEGQEGQAGLTDAFIDAVKKLPPPERLDLNSRAHTLPRHLLEQYVIFTKQRVTELPSIIEAVWKLNENGEPLGGETSEDGAPAGPVDTKCRWPAEAQKVVFDDIVLPDSANTQRVLYTQERLWVYRAALEIIAKTNEGALGNHDASVKEIKQLRVGRKATDDGLEIEFVRLDDSAQPSRSTRSTESEDTPADLPAVLKHAKSLYVDAYGRPLTDEQLAALQSTAEFKRVPVYLHLIVDQRKLHRLMTHFLNSPLRLEIQQFRFKTTDEKSLLEEDASTASDDPEEGGKRDKRADYYDTEVEIRGAMHIFYPPPSGTSDDAGGEEDAGDADDEPSEE